MTGWRLRDDPCQHGVHATFNPVGRVRVPHGAWLKGLLSDSGHVTFGGAVAIRGVLSEWRETWEDNRVET